MRKRGEAAAAAPVAPDPRQTSIPGTEPAQAAAPAPSPAQAAPSPPAAAPAPAAASAPTDIPPSVSFDNGLVFIKCRDCGLNQSSDTAKRKPVQGPLQGKALLHCLRCDGLMDPDETLTPEYVERLKVMAVAARTGRAASTQPQPPAAPPPAAPAAAAAPPPAAAPAPSPKPAEQPSKLTTPQPNPNWGPEKQCIACGKPLTQTSAGYFPSCGHPQDRVAVASTVVLTGAPEEVTVTWGEEVFRTGEFSTFRVGPFSRTTHVAPGETVPQAMTRVYDDLAQFARVTYERKCAEHLSAIDNVAGRLTERATARRAASA